MRGPAPARAERHADACKRVACRGLGNGGGGGDDASSSPADAASGSGAARRAGGATGAEAPTGDVDRPGGGTKPRTEECASSGVAPAAPRLLHNCSGMMRQGGEGCTNGIIYGSVLPKNTQMWCCPIN